MTTKSDRKVRVGIVGCGVVATAYYLPYLASMPTVEITAVCDIYPERTAACGRLFGAKQQFQDYYAMIEQANLDAVFILTGPGTHVPFTLAAVQAGKHVLLQKPMATDLTGAQAIVRAVRAAGVVALIEPSSNSLLDPVIPHLRALVRQGVLGAPYWFSYVDTGPTNYQPSMGGNPYGVGAFYSKDSGGLLFDFPYAPGQIVSLLGACKSVMGMAKISVPERFVVPDTGYNTFLSQATNPKRANYWDVVLDMPKTQHVHMEAPDNVFALYEMVDGTTGVMHVGRLFHPVLPGVDGGGLRIFGTEGNLICGAGYEASIISTRKELLPEVAKDGWYHIPVRGDHTQVKWPQPAPGSFNYYHESTSHFIDCIRTGRDPVVNVEWGLHITEMMHGAIESSRTGTRYEMVTTVDW